MKKNLHRGSDVKINIVKVDRAPQGKNITIS